LISTTFASSVAPQQASSAINVGSAVTPLSKRKGSVFYGRRRSQETIIDCLALLAERNSLAAIQRVKGVKEETVLSWLHIAAAHVEQVEALLLATYNLSRAQFDAMWSYVGTKGEKGAMIKPTSVAPSGAA
jgi:hypothetical protein